MDERKPTTSPGKFRLWSAPRRTSADIDPPPAKLANRLPFAVYRPFSGRDIYVSTRFMTISGKIDQAAGVFVRFGSPDD
jgi:hypothetical protein